MINDLSLLELGLMIFPGIIVFPGTLVFDDAHPALINRQTIIRILKPTYISFLIQYLLIYFFAAMFVRLGEGGY
jgi:hypothetical protein